MNHLGKIDVPALNGNAKRKSEQSQILASVWQFCCVMFSTLLKDNTVIITSLRVKGSESIVAGTIDRLSDGKTN